MSQADVLDSGPPGQPRRWIAVAVVAVLVLIGWNVLGSGPDEIAAPAAESHAVDTPATGVEPGPEVPANPDHADQLTFVDADNGFLMQHLCSQSTGGGACPRRILATADGGSRWEGRSVIPSYADEFYALVAHSEFDLTLLDKLSAASVVRSFDGGRSWAQFPTTGAEPAPVPAGVGLVSDLDPACTPDCPAALSWIDPSTLQLHALPSQPAAGIGDLPRPASLASDGDIAAASAIRAAGLVSVSRDGGATWVETRLPVPLQEGQEVAAAQALAAGGGRVYTFIQVFDAAGVAAKFGFRTDDGGATWAGLGLQDPPLWLPFGVLDGELLATDLPGRILLSSAGGTRWSEGGRVVGGPYLSQAKPDGPLLATIVNSQGFESYRLSPDGQDWTLIRLPGV